jgi:hypothetical protein
MSNYISGASDILFVALLTVLCCGFILVSWWSRYRARARAKFKVAAPRPAVSGDNGSNPDFNGGGMHSESARDHGASLREKNYEEQGRSFPVASGRAPMEGENMVSSNGNGGTY